MGHLFMFLEAVCYFMVTHEFKLELSSENAKIGAKFVLTSVTSISDHDLLQGQNFCNW